MNSNALSFTHLALAFQNPSVRVDCLLSCLAETSEQAGFCVSTKSALKKEKGGGEEEVSAKTPVGRRIRLHVLRKTHPEKVG